MIGHCFSPGLNYVTSGGKMREIEVVDSGTARGLADMTDIHTYCNSVQSALLGFQVQVHRCELEL